LRPCRAWTIDDACFVVRDKDGQALERIGAIGTAARFFKAQP
jgi:hypothetical protein